MSSATRSIWARIVSSAVLGAVSPGSGTLRAQMRVVGC
jgi:hypothetical protein